MLTNKVCREVKQFQPLDAGRKTHGSESRKHLILRKIVPECTERTAAALIRCCAYLLIKAAVEASAYMQHKAEGQESGTEFQQNQLFSHQRKIRRTNYKY